MIQKAQIDAIPMGNMSETPLDKFRTSITITAWARSFSMEDTMATKPKTQKRRGRPAGKKKSDTFTTKDIVACNKLISTIGDVKKAKQLVEIIGESKAA